MAVTIKNKRLYLKPVDLARKSAMHTHYSSTGEEATGPNNNKTLHAVTFYNGVARGVPENEAQRLLDDGIASERRPRLRDDDGDD